MNFWRKNFNVWLVNGRYFMGGVVISFKNVFSFSFLFQFQINTTNKMGKDGNTDTDIEDSTDMTLRDFNEDSEMTLKDLLGKLLYTLFFMQLGCFAFSLRF